MYGRLLSNGVIACGVRSAFCERKQALEVNILQSKCKAGASLRMATAALKAKVRHAKHKTAIRGSRIAMRWSHVKVCDRDQ